MMRFTRAFPWIKFGRSKKAGSKEAAESRPLREFVYLDEVSLASLLASQKGELTDNITAQSQESLLAEVGGKFGAGAPTLPSAEVSSRFQTTNSSTLQTVRKANAQSLFRELHELQGLRRIQPMQNVKAAGSMADLFNGPPNSPVYKASNLQRGDLVEFRVKLAASWIFQMSTLVAELSDMFDESPTLFMDHVKFADLYNARNANKIINRLLAGLVPINGLAPDYSVINHEGSDYVAHNDAISKLEIDAVPLQIVGVTEHLAYWKDIRRILFADNEFTMLGRISKPGIQDDWNPIKLADIFKDFAPDLANQIEKSTKLAMAQSLEPATDSVIEPNLMLLMTTLTRYKQIVIDRLNMDVSGNEEIEINRLISEIKINAGSAEGQRAAFSLVSSIIKSVTNQEFDSETDLVAREQARAELDLPLFPAPSNRSQTPSAAEPLVLEASSSRLLDVEVVAIYW